MSFKVQVLSLRGEGFTYVEIMKKLGCSKATVAYHCSKMEGNEEIKARRKAEKARAMQVPEDKEEIVRWLVADGVRRSDVADVMGLRKEVVQKFAKKNGYKMVRLLSSYERVRRRRRHLKMLAVTFKGLACQLCGYSKCLPALDFHHPNPEEKDFTIATNANRSWKAVKAEISKCQLLCCRCHREVHAEWNLNRE